MFYGIQQSFCNYFKLIPDNKFYPCVINFTSKWSKQTDITDIQIFTCEEKHHF